MRWCHYQRGHQLAEISVDELMNQRDALEKKLREAIAPLLHDFRARTGISVSYLSGKFLDVTTISDVRRQYETRRRGGRVKAGKTLRRLKAPAKRRSLSA
jgi:hypothetical protein